MIAIDRAASRGIYLGGAGPTIGEDDRRLADPATGPPAEVEHFFLEGVAAGHDPVQIDLTQLRDAVTAVAAAIVLGGQAHEQPGHRVDTVLISWREKGQFSAPPPGTYARADHHVGALHAGKHRRQVAWMMAEVGVHVDENVVVGIDGVGHGRHDGSAQPQLARTMKAKILESVAPGPRRDARCRRANCRREPGRPPPARSGESPRRGGQCCPPRCRYRWRSGCAARRRGARRLLRSESCLP